MALQIPTFASNLRPRATISLRSHKPTRNIQRLACTYIQSYSGIKKTGILSPVTVS